MVADLASPVADSTSPAADPASLVTAMDPSGGVQRQRGWAQCWARMGWRWACIFIILF